MEAQCHGCAAGPRAQDAGRRRLQVVGGAMQQLVRLGRLENCTTRFVTLAEPSAIVASCGAFGSEAMNPENPGKSAMNQVSILRPTTEVKLGRKLGENSGLGEG